jgi:dTDP-4-amino-4,6-dideoxygalactose transaminase
MGATWPSYDEDEIEAACATLKSGRVNYWTGLNVYNFERRFASYHGVKFGVAVSNATVGLDLILRCLGITASSEVLVTPRSFVASASCVNLLNAKPVFIDIDLSSGNIDADALEVCLQDHRPQCLIAVHLGGWPCEMDRIVSLCNKYSVRLIEDCSQAHGAKYKGRLVGSFGDAAVWSFCQDKIMSTGGEGGMVLTNDKELYEKMWSFKDHGKSSTLRIAKESGVDSLHSGVTYPYPHESIGTNYRMTEFQAAIGLCQLNKLDAWVIRRNWIASKYRQALEGLAQRGFVRVPAVSADLLHSYYRFYFYINHEKFTDYRQRRDQILSMGRSNGLYLNAGSCPEIYREPSYKMNINANLTNACILGGSSISVQCHPTLTDSEVLSRSELLEKSVYAILSQSAQ